MCRNIKKLSNFEPPATSAEIHASALQYVRKLSGVTNPSKTNQQSFDLAISKIEAATRELVDSLVTIAPPRNREQEIMKAKLRSEKRFAYIQTG